MITSILDFIIALSVVIIFYFTNNLASKPNKNIILATTLPYGHLNDPEVIKIAKEYKKANGYTSALSIILALPILIIKNFSFNFITFLLWIFIASIINCLTMKKYTTKLRILKSNNNWFITNKHIVRIDTKVSRLKNKMVISKLWFIPSFIINIITFFLPNNDTNIILASSGLMVTVTYLICYYIYSKKALIVFSENTDINLSCNYVYKRTWSIVWCIASSITSISTLLMVYNLNLVLFLSIAVFIVMIIIVFIAHLHIRNVQNNVLMLQENIIYTDDDEYWGPFFYKNPHDRNLIVDKRVGIGTTINMAHPKAKLLTIIFTLVTLAIFIPCIYLVISNDLSDIDFSENENSITIQAGTYDMSFNKNEIEDISLIDSLPKNGIKTNGAATEKYAYGHFKYDGYGKCMVFRKTEASHPLILIKLKDQYVILSGNNQEETNKFYTKLKR